jgi:hypothetical protein
MIKTKTIETFYATPEAGSVSQLPLSGGFLGGFIW